MIMHYPGVFWMVGILLCLVLPDTGMAANVPREPGEGDLLQEDVNIITGLYTREYSLKGDGVVDYKTARQNMFHENNKF